MGLYDKITGTKYPCRGVAPLPARPLREALLALGGSGVPFRVRETFAKERADLVAEWRIQQLGLTLRTRMRFVTDEREVLALDERWRATPASRQYGRGPAPMIQKEWTFERGPDGRRRRVESFGFDSREMKNPLRNTVLDAGWTWRGRLYRW
ncbi:hypothetical protein [Streptomyces sp. NPDC059165]|uniref:hypothetical protein n=1 Tax=Streptomyces sp. NPDC059165 TaxID=3346751 RepID=UPI00368CDFB8